MLVNLFGDVSSEATIKALLSRLARFSFTQNSSLRVAFDSAQPVTISSGVVTTVTTLATMTTGNISFGDSGKISTLIQTSASGFYNSVGKNFIRGQ